MAQCSSNVYTSTNYMISLLLCFSSSMCAGTSPNPTSSPPPDTLLDDSDLLSIYKALEHFEEWEDLGLELGLRKSTLNEISQEQRGIIKACKKAMLEAWLKWKDNVQQKGSPSWKRLLDAMRQVNAAFAAKIKHSAPWKR